MNTLKIYRSNNELYKINNFSSDADFDLIFKKIKIDAFNDKDETFGDIYYDLDTFIYHKTIYAYLASDGSLTIVDDLKRFSEGYQSEKDWKINKWTEI